MESLNQQQNSMNAEELSEMVVGARNNREHKEEELREVNKVLKALRFYETLLQGIFITHRLPETSGVQRTCDYFFMKDGKPALLSELEPFPCIKQEIPRVSLANADRTQMQEGKHGFKIRIVSCMVNGRISTSDFLVSFEDKKWEAVYKGPMTYRSETG